MSLRPALLALVAGALAEGATAAAAPGGVIFGATYDPSHPHNRRLHVSMVGNGNKVGATPLPIRNAAAPGANGRASGPCVACGGSEHCMYTAQSYDRVRDRLHICTCSCVAWM